MPAHPLGPSRRIVLLLAALFSLDSFAGGFVVQSLLALWLFERFGLSLATTGVIFFWAGVLSALSYFAASWISERIGLVNTMVFTHLPANVCLVLVPFAPTLWAAVALLLVRAAPLADGRADPHLVRHGRCHPGRARRGGQRHGGAA